MKALFLVTALLTSMSATAEVWRRHTCEVEIDQNTFKMDIYSTWDRCIGIDAGMTFKAIAKTTVNGKWKKVTGKETESHFDSEYLFKSIHSEYPGKVVMDILNDSESDSYEGRGTYYPKSGNAQSMRLTCNIGNPAGTACED